MKFYSSFNLRAPSSPHAVRRSWGFLLLKKDYNMGMIVTSKSPLETKKIAAKLAAEILLQKPSRGAKIITLQGDLGAGKTTFVQGFVRACKVKEKVKSPTFLLVKSYELRVVSEGNKKTRNSKLETRNYKILHHIDCYRVKNWKDLEQLEIKLILKDPQAIVLIEWPERIRAILPRRLIKVSLSHISPKERKISISL